MMDDQTGGDEGYKKKGLAMKRFSCPFNPVQCLIHCSTVMGNVA
jgi:hypothetical protein